ncbi:MAG: type VI secretion system tip protein TssI/VgrG [Polyangiaceae bacterium]
MAEAPSLSSLNHRLEATIATGDTLDVRHFNVAERISSLFEISLVATCDNDDVDFEAAIGQPMTFKLTKGVLPGQQRTWTGLCSQLQQVQVEDRGLSTYQITLVPTLWLLTQRRNHRMFQLKSEVDIVTQILGEWGITPVQRLSGTYKKRKYRVQYGETDFAFMSRMLEDAGISFFFEAQDGETKLVLHDEPQSAEAREKPIAYRDKPTDADLEHVTEMRIARKVRPGKYTLRDHDYRRPASYKLLASGKGGQSVEEKLERFHYTPGAFLFESDKGDATPSADDKGKYRTDEGEAGTLAQKRLDAKRAVAKTVHFDTNTVDPMPGTVLSFLDHPKSDLGAGKRFLVIASTLAGRHDSKWSNSCEAVSAENPYRPAMTTPKPKVSGVESATVVGPAGEEIHTDEFGRVRCHFHWDRESKMDDNSSCWIHTSQPWGGTGFGGSNLPRIGQEVIVDFLGGDPDRPIIVGRVYTNLQKTPYKLPDNKTQSGWQSRSSPGGSGDNYNEVMMEDKKGQELFRMQAEKDLHKLVKNDEQVKIGRDRTKNIGRDDVHNVGQDRSRTVGRNESVNIGKNWQQDVAENIREFAGQNRNTTVGVNRATQVGQIDALTVGNTHVVQISPPGEGGGADATFSLMQKDKIELGTAGGARITMEGNTITITAGTIKIESKTKTEVNCTGGDVSIKGGPKVKIND